MKGSKLRVLYFVLIAVGFGILMAVMQLFPSWSQYARSAHTSLLYLVLLAIYTAYLERSKSHISRSKEIFRLFGMKVTQGRWDRLTAFLFAGILLTPVTVQALEIPHILFTGAAIISAYIGMTEYSNDKWTFIGVSFGVMGFGLSLLGVYSIAWGEVLAAIPLAIYFITTNKLEDGS